MEYRLERRYELWDDFPSLQISSIACRGEGSERRMAFVNCETCRIAIVNLESGERMATFGARGTGAGQFGYPLGVAFSGTGELYVSDCALHRIQVFDRQGRYVRGFGTLGNGEGKFERLHGIFFTAGGELVVADHRNHRVQVLRGDGTFVRASGSYGSGGGEMRYPRDVCLS
jgi:tripartite motif-containing protein 71